MSELEDLLAFQIKAAKLPEPVRELVFAPPRRWRFDFAWPAEMLACEVDGGEWVQGRHQRPGGFRKDAEKLLCGRHGGLEGREGDWVHGGGRKRSGVD